MTSPSWCTARPAALKAAGFFCAPIQANFSSLYSQRARKGPNMLVCGPFCACWSRKGHARGARKSGRVQLAFPEIHHSPPSGFGAIDPAGAGTSTPTISTMSRASISCRVLSDP